MLEDAAAMAGECRPVSRLSPSLHNVQPKWKDGLLHMEEERQFGQADAVIRQHKADHLGTQTHLHGDHGLDALDRQVVKFGQLESPSSSATCLWFLAEACMHPLQNMTFPVSVLLGQGSKHDLKLDMRSLQHSLFDSDWIGSCTLLTIWSCHSGLDSIV
eukprot:1161207-Pelagomonas_calceolata.AAC.2